MASLHTHCCRDLFHAYWDILLDENFLHAYRHGIVLKCADADYPEKVLIAAMKDMGSCACPCCITPKNMFNSLGLLKDMRMYTLTKNQFAKKLGLLSLNPFPMLVVDFMHECELGTWKALFTHLLRLLYALPGGDRLVAALDTRFHQVPMFGDGVIQRFANNTSKMKILAACDFENILQLPKEKQARQQRFAQHSQTNATSLESSRVRTKMFNLNTYKFHAMADYVSTIRFFGTTDSYTTQMVSI
ncbi:hypothetical protein BDR06DRAFT_980185 [Suillus hirtellus]|nr:hypothetical protein BDR06DRAFT_980185 [Suillus hirtellus]